MGSEWVVKVDMRKPLQIIHISHKHMQIHYMQYVHNHTHTPIHKCDPDTP